MEDSRFQKKNVQTKYIGVFEIQDIQVTLQLSALKDKLNALKLTCDLKGENVREWSNGLLRHGEKCAEKGLKGKL